MTASSPYSRGPRPQRLCISSAIVFATFGADSKIRPADWSSFCSPVPSGCSFPLASKAIRDLPTGGEYLSVEPFLQRARQLRGHRRPLWARRRSTGPRTESTTRTSASSTAGTRTCPSRSATPRRSGRRTAPIAAGTRTASSRTAATSASPSSTRRARGSTRAAVPTVGRDAAATTERSNGARPRLPGHRRRARQHRHRRPADEVSPADGGTG